MAELFVVNGICGGTVFFLPDVPTVLGRSPECHVQVADPWISSMHALFERRGEQLWVVDLDSRNGTFVGDERVHEAPVAPGARLRFGKTSAEVRAHPEPAEPQALLSDQRTIIRYIADLVHDASLPQASPRPPVAADVEGAVVAAAAAEPRRDTVRGATGSTGVARRQIGILNEIGRSLVGATTIHEALGRLLRVLAASLGAERSAVLLMDERGEMVPLLAEPQDRPPRLSATVVQATLRSRAGILTLDAQQDLRFAQSQSVIVQGIRSCICAPIWADNRILGVLLLERGFADPFTADDLELATLVGFQAALAVERVRMAERARVSEEQRSRLLRHLDPSVAAPLLSARPSATCSSPRCARWWRSRSRSTASPRCRRCAPRARRRSAWPASSGQSPAPRSPRAPPWTPASMAASSPSSACRRRSRTPPTARGPAPPRSSRVRARPRPPTRRRGSR